MKILTVLFTSALFSLLYAFPYSGRVINITGYGIAGAEVHIVNSSETCTTNNNGYFGKPVAISGPLISNNDLMISPYIQNQEIYYYSPNAGSKISISIRTLRGQQVYEANFITSDKGKKSVPLLSNNKISKGIYIIEININGQSYFNKYIPTTSKYASMSSTNIIETRTSRKDFSSEEILRMPDSLIISANGYTSKTIFAESEILDKIILLSSTPTGMKFIPSKDSTYTAGEVGGNPLHEVSFTYDFWIDSTEVTQGDYIKTFSNSEHGFPANDYTDIWVITPGIPDTGVGKNYPAYSVTWYDCALYCNIKSKIEGLDTIYSYSEITGTPGKRCTLSDIKTDHFKNGYRLPTEAEWEYACRAGTSSDYYWGDSDHYLYAWLMQNGNYKTHEVAQKLPNNFGLYDMAGNVKEWCNDFFDQYKKLPLIDPIGSPVPVKGYINSRVVRGGSWASYKISLKSGRRGYFQPYSKFGDRGFRAVKIVK